MSKLIYIIQPYTNEEEMKKVFLDATSRLEATFKDDELSFSEITSYDESDEKELLALREFVETILTEKEVIFFLAGKFTEDNLCMSIATICKLYKIPCLLDKRIIVEAYKEELNKEKKLEKNRELIAQRRTKYEKEKNNGNDN